MSQPDEAAPQATEDESEDLLGRSPSSSDAADAAELAVAATTIEMTDPRERQESVSADVLANDEDLLEAHKIVEDRLQTLVEDELEANPGIVHAAPTDEVMAQAERNVEAAAKDESAPAEVVALVQNIQVRVKKAVAFAEERGGQGLDQSEKIAIDRQSSQAHLMVQGSMQTVLNRRRKTMASGGTGTLQTTMWFKDTPLLQSKKPTASSVFSGLSSVPEESKKTTPADSAAGATSKSQDLPRTPTFSMKPSSPGLKTGDNANLAPDAGDLADFAKRAGAQPAAETAAGAAEQSKKFGMVEGVLISCLLNIFGVIMFLRLGWVVGQAGILQSILIILMSGAVTTLTTMSMAAIATNGKVKGGGAYYMISRALGPEIGGTIGTLFFVGLSVAISIYVIGFCETLVDNFKVCPNVFDPATGMLSICDETLVKVTITGNKLNDVRFWGITLVTIILIMALFGTGWVINVQKFLMLLLTFTILSVCIGAFVNFDIEKDRLNGFVGPGSEVYIISNVNGTRVAEAIPGTSNLAANMAAKYTPQMVNGSMKEYSFFSVFAIFFPAVTGIMAGANISGLLKDPANNIVQGTFLSIGISTVVYSIMAFIIGAVCSRTALLNDYFIMMKVELLKLPYEMEIGWLVLLGVYAATFSSALASIVGAPQMLFSVAKDRILPFGFFATTHKATWNCCRIGCCNRNVLFGCYERIDADTDEATGKPKFTHAESGEPEEDGADPVFGYFISYVLAVGCICIGDINFISPLIAMFFMMTYGLLNFACFALAYFETPGWRPKFHYFHWGTGLGGGILCLIAMYLTDATYTGISLGVAILLVLWIWSREVKTNWGTVIDAKSYQDAIRAVVHLRTIRQHAKTFRPKYLLLGGDLRTGRRKALGRFLYELRRGHGGVFVGRVVKGDYRQDLHRVRERFEDFYTLINESKVTVRQGCCCRKTQVARSDLATFAPLEVCLAETFYQGACQLMQSAGTGALRPNTVVLGYKEDWQTHAASVGADREHDEVAQYVATLQVSLKMRFGTVICRNMDQVTWDAPEESGTVDVWYLLDDGGLSQLIPHIMSQAPFWMKNTEGSKKTKIRLFTIFPDGHEDVSKNAEFEAEWRALKDTIAKYRFEWEIMDPTESMLFMSDPTYPGSPAFTGNPSQSTVEQFNSYAGVTPIEATRNAVNGELSADVATQLAQWLRISEIVRRHSGNVGKRKTKAKMVFVTLPHPRSFFEPRAYMGVLESLTQGMPPMVLIKGNCKPCLTEFMD
jgi:amino acid transporter